MAEQAYAYVTLIPVAKGFQKAIAKELGGSNGVGQSAGKQAGTSFTNGFGGALKKLAIVAGGALATIGAAKFFKESITQASDLGESVNAVNVAYGEFAGDVLKLGDGVAKRLGLSTVDFNAAAVRFSAFAGKIAGDGGDVAGVVDSLSGRAADFASVFNIDVSEALQVFQSGLSGEAEPLKRFGINLLDSEVKAYAMANGIGAAGRELTETEKVQARYGLLLQETAKTQGDFANTSDGLANSQRILAASVTNLQAEVGEGLAPVMATFTAALLPLADYIFPKIASVMNTYVAPALQGVADSFGKFTTQLNIGNLDMSAVFDRIVASVKRFFDGGGIEEIFTKIADLRFAFFNAIMEALPGILEGFIKYLPELINFFVNTLLPQMLDQVIGIVAQLANLLTEILPSLVTVLMDSIPMLLDGAFNLFMSIVYALPEIITPLINGVLELLNPILSSLLKMLPDILDGALKLFLAVVDAVVLIVPDLIRAIIDLLPEIIDTLVGMLPELIDAAFELFTGIVSGLYEAAPDVWGAVGDLLPKILSTLAGFIPKIIEAGYNIIAGLVKGIITEGPKLVGNAIKSVGDSIVSTFKGLLGIQSPSKVFEGFGENIGEGLIQGLDAQQTAVVKAAEKLAKAAVPSGFEWVMGASGPYLMPTSVTSGGYSPSTAGGQAGLSTSIQSANLRAQGYSAAEIDKIFTSAVGGTAREIQNSFNKGVTLINEATNRQVMGNLTESKIADLQKQGFEVVGKIGASQDELTKAIDDLTNTIASGGAGNYLTPMATGGLVTGPTRALVGEAGPEVVIPLDRFESMMNMNSGEGKAVNYYAAPNQSIDSEQALFQAMRRAKVVANW